MEENELPRGWVWTTLGQITKVNPGLNFSSIPDSTLVSFVPMASVAAGTGFIDVLTKRPLSEVKRGYTAFQNGDILFAKITPCMENGKIAIAHSLSANIGFGSTEFHVLRPEMNIHSRLLYYHLSQEVFRQKARSYMTGSAGQLRVPSTFLLEASYSLAPLLEQQRIVAAIEQQFTRLNAGVAALKSAKTRLKRYRAAVLKAAVEGKLTETWRADHPSSEPASVLLERILVERRAKWEADLRAKGKDPAKVKYVEPATPDVSGLTELPDEWRWVSLEQCSKRITDGTHLPPPFVDEGIPFIFVTHIVKGSITFENTKYISEATYKQLNTRCPVERGDILYTAVGSYGVAVQVTTDRPFSFQRHIAHIKPSTMLPTDYLIMCLNSPIGLAQAHTVARGVAQKTVTLTDLTRFVIPLPPLEEQQQIVTEVERRLSIVSQLEATLDANLKRAERMRQSILKEAFAGRLVPQDSDDEPASVLLERIRQEREAQSKRKQGKEQSKQGKGKKVREKSNPKRQYVTEMVEQEPEPIDSCELEQVALWHGVAD